jgi:hypothetical protein
MDEKTLLPANNSISIRDYLIIALRLDLIGPRPQDTHRLQEHLPQAPVAEYAVAHNSPSANTTCWVR